MAELGGSAAEIGVSQAVGTGGCVTLAAWDRTSPRPCRAATFVRPTTRPPAATGNRVRSPAPVPVTTRLFVRCDRIPVLAMLLLVSSGRTWCLTQEHVARLSPIRVPARR